MSTPVALLGGMFDPVHRGHLAAAEYALDYFSLESIKLVPCSVPNHKAGQVATAEQRLAMLELASADDRRIEIDPIELQRDGVSYTSETLKQLYQSHESLIFLLGADAFNSLPSWHNWQAVLRLCHLMIFARPGCQLSSETMTAVEFERRQVSSADELLACNSGNIIYCEDFNFEFASSVIREKLHNGDEVSEFLHPDVERYITENRLYLNKR